MQHCNTVIQCNFRWRSDVKCSKFLFYSVSYPENLKLFFFLFFYFGLTAVHAHWMNLSTFPGSKKKNTSIWRYALYENVRQLRWIFLKTIFQMRKKNKATHLHMEIWMTFTNALSKKQHTTQVITLQCRKLFMNLNVTWVKTGSFFSGWLFHSSSVKYFLISTISESVRIEKLHWSYRNQSRKPMWQIFIHLCSLEHKSENVKSMLPDLNSW